MAIYPSGNPGVFPFDPETPVGQWRLASGDTQSVPYDPVEAGFQDYTYASDAEIEQFLAMSSGSINGAMGFWYIQLAGQAAMESKLAKDFDLQVDLTKRAADLRATAALYFDRDAASGADEYFAIVPTGPSRHWDHEELGPFWIGR